ncbi:TPA: hypothetical protein EYP37_01935 [Candidatus Poribacteria bacterium]|nr:hypothetical protein [Candidatus Poribacteria bacterium]
MFMEFVALGCLVLSAASPQTANKKLIEFGWDEPDTTFIKEHISEMERMPFDGCVFHVNYRKPDGGTGSFTWECWGKRKFGEEELKHAVENLKNTPFKRFKHNFLRFNVTPGEVDWFDDFSAIISNAKLAAKIAREGGCKGLLFDIEQYNFPLFNYQKQKYREERSWNQYALQVRRRGEELMKAFQSEYPDITIFLTFGYSLPWAQSDGGRKELADVSYGLLAPLLDGMVEAANGRSLIVDGCELAYPYKEVNRFEQTYKMMERDVLKIVANPEKYRKVFSFGFGVWMDCNWRKVGWHTDDFSLNFYTPEEFERSLYAALNRSDRYVWIYTEKPRWWTASGGPQDLPDEYIQAVWNARKRIGASD